MDCGTLWKIRLKQYLMKCFLSIITVFAVYQSCLSQAIKELSTDSKIERVTVYFNGAQIERHSSIKIDRSGKHLFRIKGIEPGIVLSTLQIKTPKGVSIDQVSSEVVYTETENHDLEIEQLRSQIKDLKYKLEDVNDQISLVQTQRSMLDENRDKIGSGESAMTVETWKSGVTYYETKTSELKLKQRKNERLALKIQGSIQENIDRLSEITGTSKKQSVDILIEGSCSKALPNGKFEVTYLLPDASWKPRYDLKMNGLDKPLDLQVKAEVRQSTGSDWNNVNLVLTSEDPFASSEKPNLVSWDPELSYRPTPIRKSTNAPKTGKGKVFGFVRDSKTSEPIPFANVVIRDGDEVLTGVSTDFEGKFLLKDVPVGNDYTLQVSYIGYSNQERENVSVHPNNSTRQDIRLTENSLKLQEVVVSSSKMPSRGRGSAITTAAGVQDNDGEVGSIRGTRSGSTYSYIDGVKVNGANYSPSLSKKTTRVQYETTTRKSIPSDNKNHVVQLDMLEVVANFRHYSAPVELNKAFLISKVIGWEEFNLLDGRVALHVDGTFIGESTLHAGKVADTLVLSMGTDSQIIVNRIQTKKYSKKALLTGKKTEERSYKLGIKNTRSETVTIQIQDQIPVSSNKEVEVELDENGGGILNEKTGVIEWNIEIPPGSIWETEFSFSVKYPNETRVYID